MFTTASKSSKTDVPLSRECLYRGVVEGGQFEMLLRKAVKKKKKNVYAYLTGIRRDRKFVFFVEIITRLESDDRTKTCP